MAGGRLTRPGETLRVVFFGTPDWAIPSLDALLASRHEVVAVVTQPDRPRGRSRRPSPCPVAARAASAGRTLLKPETLKDAPFRASFHHLGAGAAVVVAYGRIVPRSLLGAMPFVNVHFSLLPRWRGAAPVQRAIVAGDSVTGVTTMLMDAGVDTGGTLLSRETEVHAEETAGDLGSRLAVLGASLVVETLEALEAGRIAPTPQDESRATLAPAITADEAWVDWSDPAAAIARKVRAFQPWPVARALVRGRGIRILRAAPGGPEAGAAPGEVLRLGGEGVVVACGGGETIVVTLLQPASGRPMSGRDAISGRHLRPGDVLASPPPASGAGPV